MAVLYKDAEGFAHWVIRTTLSSFEHNDETRYIVTVEADCRDDFSPFDILIKEVLFDQYCRESIAIRQSVHMHEEAMKFGKHLEYLDYLFEERYTFIIHLLLNKWEKHDPVRVIEHYANGMRNALPDESDEVLYMVQHNRDVLMAMLDSLDESYQHSMTDNAQPTF